MLIPVLRWRPEISLPAGIAADSCCGETYGGRGTYEAGRELVQQQQQHGAEGYAELDDTRCLIVPHGVRRLSQVLLLALAP